MLHLHSKLNEVRMAFPDKIVECGLTDITPAHVEASHFELLQNVDDLCERGLSVHTVRNRTETELTHVREPRRDCSLISFGTGAVDGLKRQQIWKAARPLLCLVALFSVVVSLAGCERKPLTERNASEPDGPTAGHVQPHASSISSVRAIVDAGEAMLFGAVADGGWVPVGRAAPLIREGMTYGLYTLTRRLGERQGGKARSPSERCSNPSVDIIDVPHVEADVIAVGGSWNALPRAPSFHSTQQRVYRDLVAKWLRAQGIADPLVHITQILRVDLEGDNIDEVLIAANLSRGTGTSTPSGDYSVVLLRKIVMGEVRSIPLVEEYYQTGCSGECAPATHRVALLLDLSGDGVMEVVLAWRGYQARGKMIYQVKGTEVSKVFSWACAP